MACRNGDDSVTLAELKQWVDRRVPLQASKVGGKQTPITSLVDAWGDVYLTRSCHVACDAAPLAGTIPLVVRPVRVASAWPADTNGGGPDGPHYERAETRSTLQP